MSENKKTTKETQEVQNDKNQPQNKNGQSVDKEKMLKIIKAQEVELENFSKQFTETIRSLRQKIEEESKEAEKISKVASNYVKTAKNPLKSQLSSSELREINNRYISRVDGIFGDHTKYLESLSAKCKLNEIPKNIQVLLKKINIYQESCKAENYANLKLEDLDKEIKSTVDSLNVSVRKYKYQFKSLKDKYSNRLGNAQSEYHSDIRKAVVAKRLKGVARGVVAGVMLKSLYSVEKDKNQDKTNQRTQTAIESAEQQEIKNLDAEHQEIVKENAKANNFIMEIKNPDSEQEFNNLMRQFSSIHNDYYTGDKGITGRPHAMREIKDKRAINKQMRKIISQRAESVAITEHGFMDTNVVNKIMNPISSLDINSLATNEIACKKLFQLQATGFYEKNGVRTELTPKQRAAISSILLKVSEQRLGDEQYKRELITKAPREMQAQQQQEQIASMGRGGY